jgi:CheY-like chemotaxis protein
MKETQSLKVLIVDDEKHVRIIVKAYLSPFDAEIFEAADGKAAIDLVHKEKFDIAIIDYYLPDINGKELIEKILQEDEYRDMPIIMYTSGDFRKDFENVLKSSTTAFIKKINLGNDLVPAVKEVLGNRFVLKDSKDEAGQEPESPKDSKEGTPTCLVTHDLSENQYGKVVKSSDIFEDLGTESDVPDTEEEKPEVSVLICFKESMDAILVSSYLSKYGIKTINADNGADAFVRIDETKPLLVIIDDIMITETVFSMMPGGSPVPLIVTITGSADDDTLVRLAPYKTATLKKPIKEEKLIEVVRKIPGVITDNG